MTINFVSLYTGAGGMDLGFMDAGMTPVWSNDIDPTAVETYKAELARRGIANHTATVGDIRDQGQKPSAGDADLVIGGPPCQGFSVAGRMDPNDPRSRHVWDFLGMVARVQPKAFVMENVKALLVNRRWSALIGALKDKAERIGDGYRVEAYLLNASHYGVPQARERMFLVGVPTDCELPDFTSQLTADNPPTVRDAFQGLPALGEPGNDSLCTAKVTLAKNPVLRKSPYAGMLFNGQGRPLNLDGPALTLPASMGGNRTPIIDQDELENGGEPWIVQYHRRLWEDGKKPLKRVPRDVRLRRLSVEESAALQTFPTEMAWKGRQSAQYRQIGNAVPPVLAQHVASAVVGVLGESQTTTGRAIPVRQPLPDDAVHPSREEAAVA